MGKTAINLAIALGLITVVFAGYYMYTENAEQYLNFDTNEQTMQNMLNNTGVFIERRKTLDRVELDIGFFEDNRFTTLRKFTTPIQERPIGRQDPFAETQINNTASY